MAQKINKNLQYYKFCLYGFFKNLRFFDAFLILFFLASGVSYLQIGLLYSVREITLAIFEIPSGIIADAFGRKKTLMVSFVTYILSFMIFYVAENYSVFYIAMILFAFAEAFRTGVHKAMIYHYLKVNNQDDLKVRYYGHTRSWSQVGTAVSALVAGFLVLYTDSFRIVFLASVVPYIVGLFLIMSYPKYLDGVAQKISAGSIITQFKSVIIAFWKSIASARMIKLLINSSLYTGYYRAIKDYFQLLLKSFALAVPVFAYMSDRDRVAITVGIFYFVTYLLTAVASRKSGAFVELFKNPLRPMNLTIMLGFITGAIAGALFVSGWLILAVVVFIAILMIENLRKPIGVAMITDQSKQEAYASVLSTSSKAKSIFSAILALLIGWLADQFSPGIAIAATSLILLLSLPMYWLNNKNQ